MRAKSGMLAVVTVLLAGCGSYDSLYEEGVRDYEPIYCYRNIGGIACFDAPRHRDQRRLVNYYGPAPDRYDRPEPPPEPRLDPPPAHNYYVRDPEPIPRPAPHGALDDRPWLSFGFEPTPEARPHGPLGDRPWLPPGYRPQSGPKVEDDPAVSDSSDASAGGEAPID